MLAGSRLRSSEKSRQNASELDGDTSGLLYSKEARLPLEALEGLSWPQFAPQKPTCHVLLWGRNRQSCLPRSSPSLNSPHEKAVDDKVAPAFPVVPAPHAYTLCPLILNTRLRTDAMLHMACDCWVLFVSLSIRRFSQNTLW